MKNKNENTYSQKSENQTAKVSKIFEDAVLNLPFEINHKKLEAVGDISQQLVDLVMETTELLTKLDNESKLDKDILKRFTDIKDLRTKAIELSQDNTAINWNLTGKNITKYDQELFDKYLGNNKQK